MTKEPTTKELEQKVAELKDAHEQLIIYARELKEEIKSHKKVQNALAEERERFEQSNHAFRDLIREEAESLRSLIRSYLVMGDLSVFETSTKADSVKPDPDQDQDTLDPIGDFNQSMHKQEKRLVLKALNQYRWHRAKTAAALKMDPKTLYTKMKKLGIT